MNQPRSGNDEDYTPPTPAQERAQAKEHAKMVEARRSADLEAKRKVQLKVIDQMQAEIAGGAKFVKVWEARKKAAAAFIDVSVFKSGLAPALTQYRSTLKGAYDVMRMHGELNDKGKNLVATQKAKVDAALKAYMKLAEVGQQRPSDKMSQAKGGKIDVKTQQLTWKQIATDLAAIKRYVDEWHKNVVQTAEQQRKAMQGEYRR